MIYLAQMLKDCNKNRSSSFTEMSFPIIQEIENKIKNKNGNLRKKMRQRLVDKLKLPKIQEKKQQPSAQVKKDAITPKNDKEKEKQKQKEKEKERQKEKEKQKEKEIINYIDAYDDQKIQPIKPYLFNHETKLDQSETQVTFLIYQLMRKRKPIFKIDEIRRKIKSKQTTKRMNYKQCECCDKIGRHKCPHTLCEGNCEKLKKSQKMEIQSCFEDREAIELAQEVIEQQVKEENLTLTVMKVLVKQQQGLVIPNIDNTEKQERIQKEELEEQLKEEQKEEGSLSQRGRISQNQSKSEISESRRNKSKLKESQQNSKISPPLQNDEPEKENEGDGQNNQMQVQEQPRQEIQQQIKENSDRIEPQIQNNPSNVSIEQAIKENKQEQKAQKQQQQKNGEGSGFLDDLLFQLHQYEDQS